MGIAISVVNTDTRNQIVRVRTNFSMARVTSVEHMGTKKLTVLFKTVAHLESVSVIEPNEEPAGIECTTCSSCALSTDTVTDTKLSVSVYAVWPASVSKSDSPSLSCNPLNR